MSGTAAERWRSMGAIVKGNCGVRHDTPWRLKPKRISEGHFKTRNWYAPTYPQGQTGITYFRSFVVLIKFFSGQRKTAQIDCHLSTMFLQHSVLFCVLLAGDRTFFHPYLLISIHIINIALFLNPTASAFPAACCGVSERAIRYGSFSLRIEGLQAASRSPLLAAGRLQIRGVFI